MSEIDNRARVGNTYEEETSDSVLGERSRIRRKMIIYDDMIVGDKLSTEHFALLLEFTDAGANVSVGSQTVVDERTGIGSNVSLQTGGYVPSQTTIGDNVLIGPSPVLANDSNSIRQDVDLNGLTLKTDVSVRANATILHDITRVENSVGASGPVVTEDGPVETLAVETPATHRPFLDALVDAN